LPSFPHSAMFAVDQRRIYPRAAHETSRRVPLRSGGVRLKISFDFDIPPGDIPALAAALGCPEADVAANLPGHAKAALGEYVEAYLGRRAFSRGSDILEHRLSLLIEHAYGNRVPSEAEVSNIFQTTLTSSRSLLRAALTKYRYRLKGAVVASATAALERAVWNKDDNQYTVEIHAANIVDYLNQRLATEFAGQKRISPAKDSISIYAIAPGTYDELCRALKAKPVAR
jgi:hypothetical protein